MDEWATMRGGFGEGEDDGEEERGVGRRGKNGRGDVSGLGQGDECGEETWMSEDGFAAGGHGGWGIKRISAGGFLRVGVGLELREPCLLRREFGRIRCEIR